MLTVEVSVLTALIVMPIFGDICLAVVAQENLLLRSFVVCGLPGHDIGKKLAIDGRHGHLHQQLRGLNPRIMPPFDLISVLQ